MDLSHAFRALGHPHRLAIVEELRQRVLSCCDGERADECTLDPASCDVGSLADVVPCAPSTLSHHLKELERAGIIERVRDGRRIFCRIREGRLSELRRFLAPEERPADSPGRLAARGAPHGD
jgi:ArsR family transcriptional regulator